ncbi:MAG TPA: NAD(P)-binding domain-containing protein [Actinophytocola sp.]|uniref:NAD(P)-binding domain-containing protein n=1 Tax=Actinophytocola sp. TaxID=1872138 RepID=UPI002DDD2D69|nr:NAD(P)-binding domain-containing protein [Actinophytocola sp.]HEV2779203.1 NAD(P)-binding domain-containing protein [Actinophytocola sp.]
MVTTTDYLVIGAGPAGLQLGYFLQRAGRDYLILEAGGTPGGFFRTFPRHRQLLSINKPHTGFNDPELNLRMDWNSLLSDRESLLFTRYTKRYFPNADVMVRYLADYARALGLNIRYDTRVVRVSRTDERFRVLDEQGNTYEAPLLIVATGPAKPYVPTIPGIETAELYGTVTVDPLDFLDQRVLIIGKGNSAFETAGNLIETAAVIHLAGPGSMRAAWRSHHVGQVLNGLVRGIDRTEQGYRVTVRFARADETIGDLHYDRVIVCTGFRFDSSIFAAGCRPELAIGDRFPAQTSAWESVNVPDLYFAGTLMQARDFPRSASGSIHGFRYCIRALHRILERRYHGSPWPPRGLPADPEALTVALLCRANRASALWQQSGRLCDLVVPEGSEAAYYEELPCDYVPDSQFGAGGTYFTLTLERGCDRERVASLHPVVRHYRHGVLLAEHHVAENLENEWTDQQAHRAPLRAFLDRELDPAGRSATIG